MFELLTAFFAALFIAGFFTIITIVYYVLIAMFAVWLFCTMYDFFFKGKK
jgi:uncharacterized membrane protein YuzA (DUF378 family)